MYVLRKLTRWRCRTGYSVLCSIFIGLHMFWSYYTCVYMHLHDYLAFSIHYWLCDAHCFLCYVGNCTPGTWVFSCQILQSESGDTVHCTEITDNFKLLLQQFRVNFHSLWEGILKITHSSYSVTRSRKHWWRVKTNHWPAKQCWWKWSMCRLRILQTDYVKYQNLNSCARLTSSSLQTTSGTSPLKH